MPIRGRCRVIDHLEVLVEELSMEVALRSVLPRIVPAVSFEIRVFQGKHDLLKQLGDRLRGYRGWLPTGMGIVVIVDRDEEDCLDLKEKLEKAARQAGFETRSASDGGRFQVLNRIAVEELEAWFFGDVAAVRKAYPRVPESLGSHKAYRNPDAIKGGTAEALERVLRGAGHFPGGLAKMRAAREISAHMDVENNQSRSFCEFRDGVRRLVNQKEEAR